VNAPVQTDSRHDPRPVFAAYGDSLVAGWGVADADALPARLEECFARRASPGGC